MEQTPDIVVIAPEAIIRSELESLLNALEYETRAFDNFLSVDEFKEIGLNPDLIILQVEGDDIASAEALVKGVNAYRKTPIIYVTDTKDEIVFSRLKETKPFAFLAKPLDLGAIRRNVELAILYDSGNPASPVVTLESNGKEICLEGANPPFFFTKVGNKLKRIPIDEVRYVEVEGKYSSIHLTDRKYNVKASLKDLLEKFPSDRFVRVSRNYVVNLDFIDHIDTMQYQVKVVDRDIPISRTYKDELMGRISLL